MYHDLGSGSAVTLGTSTHSQPIALAATENAIQCNMVVFNIWSEAIITVKVQLSNDLENWATPSGSSPWTQQMTTLGSKLFVAATGISSAYVRLKISTDVGTSIIAYGLNSSSQ